MRKPVGLGSVAKVHRRADAVEREVLCSKGLSVILKRQESRRLKKMDIEHTTCWVTSWRKDESVRQVAKDFYDKNLFPKGLAQWAAVPLQQFAQQLQSLEDTCCTCRWNSFPHKKQGGQNKWTNELKKSGLQRKLFYKENNVLRENSRKEAFLRSITLSLSKCFFPHAHHLLRKTIFPQSWF